MASLPRLLAELQRRRVGRVAAAYAVVAWLIVEVANTVFPRLLLPDWTVTAIIVAALAGFPIAVVLAWSFDVVPDDASRGLTSRRRRTVGIALIVVMIATLAAMSTRLAERVQRRGMILDSIVVLPFENLSGDPDQEYFAAGMHDAVISELSRIGALRRVISRRSAVHYRNSDKTLDEIARELNVEGILEGSVTPDAGEVHVRLRLIRVHPDEQSIWSASYDRRLTDLPALHADIARAIAAEIRAELTPELTMRHARTTAVDPVVYDAYLRGMYHLHQGTRDAVEEGLRHLHRAVELNPGDARAYAGLALGYTNIGHGFAPPPDVWPRAREAALRAVRLDPTLAEAHAALAEVRMYADWDWEAAEAEFLRANELNPALAENHYHYAWFLTLFDRMDEAIVEHRRAQELDPLTPAPTAWLGELYVLLGRYDDAIAEANRALELRTNAPAGLTVLGNAYIGKRMWREAIETHSQLAAHNPNGRWWLGRTYALAGEHERARQTAAEIESGEMTSWNAFGLAMIYASLGDADRAFHWLEYQPAHSWLLSIRYPHWFGGIHDDPRFQQMLDRMGLEPWGQTPATSRRPPTLSASDEA